MAVRRPKNPSPRPGAIRSLRSTEPPRVDDDPLAPRIGEWLRRAALGLLAALLVARPYWPCEGVREEETGLGLAWVWTMLLCLSIGVAGRVIGGADRFRISKADVAVFALIALVGLSVSRAFSMRPAINLAWEWVGVGVAYFLIRNLPRTRRESSVLAAIFMATAVAVSAHALYSNRVVLASLQEQYRRDPDGTLKQMGIAPGSPGAARARDRLLYSNETIGPFALANSLAGFLVGPAVLGLAVGLEGLRKRREKERPSAIASLLAIISYAIILAALLFTKSRSAYIGFAVGAVVLLVREGRKLDPRKLAIPAIGFVAALGGLIALGVATKRLDWMMVVDSTKSFRYRLEYWQGAWRAISKLHRAFWLGLGPGQFGSAYLRYRLPESSEEIQDPHNLILEAWAVAGIGAAIALSAAIGFALREAFGAEIKKKTTVDSRHQIINEDPEKTDFDKKERVGWLTASGAAGWALAAVLAPKEYGPFGGENLSLITLILWLILAVSWGLAIALGAPFWRKISVPAAGLGAAGLAVAVNLLAAGGIGFSAVALGLWGMLALAQNVREDRPCGRARVGGGRLSGFASGVVAAALVGTFIGTVFPFWDAERRRDAGLAELRKASAANQPALARRASLNRARAELEEATRQDVYFSRPWIELASIEFQAWLLRGSPSPPQDPIWSNLSNDLRKASSFKNRRAPYSLEIQQTWINDARALLKVLGDQAPREFLAIFRRQIHDSARLLVDFDPTNASFRAQCAVASAEVGQFDDAISQAETALELHARTPHADRKLNPDSVKLLQALLPDWKAELKKSKNRQ